MMNERKDKVATNWYINAECSKCGNALASNGYDIWFTCNCLHNGLTYVTKDMEESTNE